MELKFVNIIAMDKISLHKRGWYLNLQLPMQSVPITTKVVSLNPVHGKVYSIQHYVIKFLSDLRHCQWFPPPIKLTSMQTKPNLSIREVNDILQSN